MTRKPGTQRRVKTLSVRDETAPCIARFSPQVAAQLKAARGRLRKMFPRGCELVYDNYNALVFAFAPSDRTSEAVLSVAAYPRWVTLFFANGAKLRDPDKLLRGEGSRVRGVRLASAARLDDPGVRALIEQALLAHRAAFLAAPALRTTIKSLSAKRRARRPSAATAGN